MKGGHGFEIEVRMDNLRGEKQNKPIEFEVCTLARSSLFSVVLMCLISPTQKFKLEKITLNTEE